MLFIFILHIISVKCVLPACAINCSAGWYLSIYFKLVLLQLESVTHLNLK